MANDLRNTIMKLNERFMETYRRGDARGMGELYTEEGRLLPPGSDVIRGRDAIARFWGGAMEAGVREVHLQTGTVEAHGDAATEVGTAKLRGTDGGVLDELKYVVLWKRDGDGWQLDLDIWNSSRPAA